MNVQDIPVDRLGPFAILQFAVAAAVFCGIVFAIYRGTRDKQASGGMPQIPQEQRWFFDGPLSVAIGTLRDIRNHLDRLVETQTPIPEELRKQTELLREIKNEVDQLKEIKTRRR